MVCIKMGYSIGEDTLCSCNTVNFMDEYFGSVLWLAMTGGTQSSDELCQTQYAGGYILAYFELILLYSCHRHKDQNSDSFRALCFSSLCINWARYLLWIFSGLLAKGAHLEAQALSHL